MSNAEGADLAIILAIVLAFVLAKWNGEDISIDHINYAQEKCAPHGGVARMEATWHDNHVVASCANGGVKINAYLERRK